MPRSRTPDRILVISDDKGLHTAAAWTAKRANVPSSVEDMTTVADARDALTLRVRDGVLPYVTILDTRRHAVAGVEFLRWVAQDERVAQMLVIAIVSSPTHADMLHGLGADFVATSMPDAAKFRQLWGIATQLCELPKKVTDAGVERAALQAWKLNREQASQKN